MATQYSTILKLALPTQGELSGTWGDVVNDNITSMVEEAIAGRAVINTWTANSHTLTTANGTTSESRCAMLEFTDTGTALSGAGTVICPTASKIYICKNDAGQTVTIKTSAGTGVDVADGETKFVFCDGTNVVEAVTSMATLKVGTGVQVSTILDEDDMASDSATALATQQSIKAYINSQVTAQDLDIAGDTGTGAVDLDSQSLTIAGTANEIETSASGQTITVGLPTAIVVTTITTTNVQATNIKANDGSTAITIADSTGQVTVADAVLTTADINGGSADGVTIGAATPAAGSFTTLGASGTTSLGGALALTGNLDINTNKFNVTAADGNTTIAGTLGVTGNVDLNGGTIDGTVIGGSSAAAGTFTSITGTSANISGNVGIGTTTVSNPFSVASAVQIGTTTGTGSVLTLGGSGGALYFADSGSGYAGYINYQHTDNSLRLGTNATERARIDSSGNLLVGKTATSFSTAGVQLNNDGQAAIIKSGGSSLYARRTTDSGHIAEFAGASATIGYIGGDSSGYLYTGAVDTALIYDNGNNSIQPYQPNVAGYRDNAVDLGGSSARFRNLYLSGGVYLGGTGAANLLDDYEEGTWTPTLIASGTNPTVSYGSQSGTYTKIGRFVTCEFAIILSTFSGGSGDVRIAGLPFTSDGDDNRGSMLVSFSSGFPAGYAPVSGLIDANSIFAVLRAQDSSGNISVLVNVSQFSGNEIIRGTIAYHTT